MNPTQSLAPPVLVKTPAALRDMVARLQDVPIVAVDTESNGFYAYFEKVCLIQFSVPGTDYLVDPLVLPDLSPLGPLFADPAIEKVFHAAEYDIMCLRRDFGFSFAHLFDTMVASRILGWRHHGLGPILKDRFSVVLDKRMQRYNWGRRPLEREHLEYARLDTHYLLPLRDIMRDELVRRGRWQEATEAFERLTHATWTAKEFDPDGFWHVKGAQDLDGPALAVLRALYLYREEQAMAQDRAPFRVLTDQTMVRLSRERPTDRTRLSQVKGMSRYLVQRYGRGILNAIRRGKKAEFPRRPPSRNRGHRPDEPTLARYDALRRWRKERAARRGVEPDVVVSNDTLMALARRAPTTPQALAEVKALGDWQANEYGDEILAVIRSTLQGRR